MSFWKNLFGGKSNNTEKKGNLSADTTAKLKLAAANLTKAALALNNAQTPKQGRTAMKQAADFLENLKTTNSQSLDLLRNTSDLDDAQILPLCRQMAANLERQASTFTRIAEDTSSSKTKQTSQNTTPDTIPTTVNGNDISSFV